MLDCISFKSCIWHFSCFYPPLSYWNREKIRVKKEGWKRKIRGTEKVIGEMEGIEISCPIQGRFSIHVLSRHHLLEEHVSLPMRRMVQAFAKTCCNTTATVTNGQTNIPPHTEKHTYLYTLENSALILFCSSECLQHSCKNLQSLWVCRYLWDGKYWGEGVHDAK